MDLVVKLNNPLMGTETQTYRQHIKTFNQAELN